MSNTIKNNTNWAVVEGEIISDFEYSHETFGEAFYNVKLRVSRLSECMDTIPLLVSERMVDVTQSYRGRFVEARGQFRSFDQHVKHKRHLVVSLFVKELYFLDALYAETPNVIFLDGYICKEPHYRKTPFGREITDILLAVNRAYSKSDYIPCICWGRNAKFARKLAVGTRIQIYGRIQSREYYKKIDGVNIENYVTYEISIAQIDVCEKENTSQIERVAESKKMDHRRY